MKDDVIVCWDIGLNKCRIVYFSFGVDENVVLVMLGDFL